MAKHWAYTEAPGRATGTMVCGVCNKLIAAGEFRYRQKSKGGDWGYVQQHRACCADDPEWAALDNERAFHAARYADFVEACRAFKERWGVSELDEYIANEPERQSA